MFVIVVGDSKLSTATPTSDKHADATLASSTSSTPSASPSSVSTADSGNDASLLLVTEREQHLHDTIALLRAQLSCTTNEKVSLEDELNRLRVTCNEYQLQISDVASAAAAAARFAQEQSLTPLRSSTVSSTTAESIGHSNEASPIPSHSHSHNSNNNSMISNDDDSTWSSVQRVQRLSTPSRTTSDTTATIIATIPLSPNQTTPTLTPNVGPSSADTSAASLTIATPTTRPLVPVTVIGEDVMSPEKKLSILQTVIGGWPPRSRSSSRSTSRTASRDVSPDRDHNNNLPTPNTTTAANGFRFSGNSESQQSQQQQSQRPREPVHGVSSFVSTVRQESRNRAHMRINSGSNGNINTDGLLTSTPTTPSTTSVASHGPLAAFRSMQLGVAGSRRQLSQSSLLPLPSHLQHVPTTEDAASPVVTAPSSRLFANAQHQQAASTTSNDDASLTTSSMVLPPSLPRVASSMITPTLASAGFAPMPLPGHHQRTPSMSRFTTASLTGALLNKPQ
jgi:hypothetical protein